MKNKDWDFTEDPLTYLHSDPSYYVQYTQTSFLKPHAKLVNTKNGAYVTSIDQTQISEFEKSLDELRKYGFPTSDYLVSLGNRCSKTGYYQKCKDGHMNFKPHYGKGKDHKWTCHICNRSRSKSLGRVKFHTIRRLQPDYIGYLELTLPNDHYKYCTRNNANAREDTENYLREKTKQFINEYFPGYGHYNVIHDWGTHNPLAFPHYHSHNVIPLVKIENGKKILANSGYISDERLEEMRHRWAEILGYKGEVDIHYRFGSLKPYGKYGLGYLRHYTAYISRGPICDINEWLLENGNPKELSEYRLKWFYFFMDQIRPNYKRYRGYGLLCEGKIGQFLKDCNSHLELVHRDIQEEKEESKKLYCCTCNAELDPTHWVWYEGFISREKFAKSKERWQRYLYLTNYILEFDTS